MHSCVERIVACLSNCRLLSPRLPQPSDSALHILLRTSGAIRVDAFSAIKRTLIGTSDDAGGWVFLRYLRYGDCIGCILLVCNIEIHILFAVPCTKHGAGTSPGTATLWPPS